MSTLWLLFDILDRALSGDFIFQMTGMAIMAIFVAPILSALKLHKPYNVAGIVVLVLLFAIIQVEAHYAIEHIQALWNSPINEPWIIHTGK